MWKKNKKRIGFMIAVLLIIILTIELIGIFLVTKKRENDVFYYTEEMNREATKEAIYNPLDVVQVVMDACREQDLDKFIRGTAVQEMADGMNLEVNLMEGGRYLQDGFGLPSGDWKVYSPLNVAVYANNSAQMYRRIMNEFAQPEKIRIISVDYLNPDFQVSEENGDKIQTECAIWSADAISNVSALIQYDDDYYMVAFDTLKYDDSWKVKVSDDVMVSKVTKEQYDIEVNYSEKSVQSYEYRYAIATRSEFAENTLLPLNYFLIDNSNKLSGEALIQNYLAKIKKSDMYGVMSCFNQKRSTTEEWLSSQSQHAWEIIASLDKTMDYRMFIGYNLTSEISRAAGTIVQALNPEQLMYLECSSTMKEKRSDNEMVYKVDVLLNGITISSDITLKKDSEDGCSIVSIATDKVIQ